MPLRQEKDATGTRLFASHAVVNIKGFLKIKRYTVHCSPTGV